MTEEADSASPYVERYLLLGLRLGKHIDGLVDAYYGPPALADRVQAEPVFDAARLGQDARELRAAIPAMVNNPRRTSGGVSMGIVWTNPASVSPAGGSSQLLMP